MADVVGAASIRVTPDFRDFHTKIAAEFKAASGEAEKWGADAGKKFASAFQDELRARFAKLPHAKIEADADTAKADEQIDRAARKRSAKIELKPEWLGGSPLATLGILGGAALGPQAVGLAAGVTGAGVAFGAAAITAGAFGAVASTAFKKVTTAQAALTKAQAAYTAATTGTQRTAALKAEQQATAGLTGSEHQLLGMLTKLQTGWQNLTRSQEAGVVSGLKPWFAVAEKGLTFLPSLTGPASKAIGYLGTQAKNALDKPFWRTFFRELGQTGNTSLVEFGEAAGKAGDGLAHLFIEFKPDIDRIPGLINKWAGAFDKWATSYKRSGFDKFMRTTFSPSNLANLKEAAESAGTLFGNAADAVEQISPAALTGLSNVLVALSKLTPGQIEALGVLYTVGKVTGNAGSVGKLAGLLGGAKGVGKTAGTVEGAESASKGSAALAAVGGVPGLALIGGIIGEAALNKLASMRGAPGVAGKDTRAGITSAAGGPANASPGDVLSIGRTFLALQSDNTKLTQLASRIGANVGHALGTGWSATSGWVSARFRSAKGWVTGALAGANNWLTAKGVNIAHGLGDAWSATAGWVSGQFRRGKQWVTNAFTGASGWLSSKGTSVAHGFGNAWSAAGGWVRSQFGKAKGWATSALSGAGSWLTGAGRAIIGGLVSGIRAAVPTLTSALHWVTSLIPLHKGPLSTDARLLWPNGRAVMGGFIGGIGSQLPALRSQLGSVTRSVGPSLGLPGVTGQLATGGLTLSVAYTGPRSGLVDAVVKDLRYDIAGKSGGDVQKHLGKGKART